MIAMQGQTPLVDKAMKIATQWLSWYQGVTAVCNAVQTSGPTSQRPTGAVSAGTSPRLWLGMPYFDTTLGTPIWLKSTGPIVWVNASGAPV